MSDDDVETAEEAAFDMIAKHHDDWTMVEGEDVHGLKSVVDKKSGTIVHSLSSQDTRDVDRWLIMPSLAGYSSSLKKLDLYKNRYMKELHESVCDLSNLEFLSLVRCERLSTLPDRIGNLQNLRELDLTDASEISSLPESFGDLHK